ncbi:MAG: hypothetical protein JSR28_07585, partial [Proteobacteria bacterium]|nr:hypothetical protein [Pseudomonadota bacterium]
TKYVSVDAGAGYLPWDDANAVTGPETSVDTAVRFKVVLTNTGNVTLTGIHLSDLLHDYASNTNSPINYTTVNAGVDLNNDGTVDASWASLDANNDGTLDTTSLAVGGSITVYYNLDFVEGQHTNTATVTTTQGVTDTDAANYYGLHVNTGPGVRTPGFWNHWTNLWDGTAVGDPKQMGQPGFPGQDVLYKVDSNGDGVINGNDKAGLLIGDWNMDGKQSVGEDVIFISLDAARSLVGAANKTVGNDGVQILGRDLIASWLNFIEGNAIDAPGTADDSHNPQHFIQDAINYLQTYAGSDSDSPATDTFDVFKFDGHKVTKTSSTYWNTPLGVGGDAHTGGAIHSALDTYNNTGTIDGIMYAGSADNATFLAVLSQVQMP